MVPEAPLERTDLGLVPAGEGWFVLNAPRPAGATARDGGSHFRSRARWTSRRSGSTSSCSGRASRSGCTTGKRTRRTSSCSPARRLLIVEGEERPLRQWDFVHCPAETQHMIVGAGTGRASSSPSARAASRTGGTGAATPSTRSPSGTAPASSERRATRTRPTPVSRIPGRRATATAGFPASCVAPVEPDRPGVDRIDHEMGLAPRIAPERRADIVLRPCLDGEHDAELVGERAAENDEAVGDETVHEVCVLLPAGLLLERERRIPLRAGASCTTKNIATDPLYQTAQRARCAGRGCRPTRTRPSRRRRCRRSASSAGRSRRRSRSGRPSEPRGRPRRPRPSARASAG